MPAPTSRRRFGSSDTIWSFRTVLRRGFKAHIFKIFGGRDIQEPCEKNAFSFSSRSSTELSLLSSSLFLRTCQSSRKTTSLFPARSRNAFPLSDPTRNVSGLVIMPRVRTPLGRRPVQVWSRFDWRSHSLLRRQQVWCSGCLPCRIEQGRIPTSHPSRIGACSRHGSGLEDRRGSGEAALAPISLPSGRHRWMLWH